VGRYGVIWVSSKCERHALDSHNLSVYGEWIAIIRIKVIPSSNFVSRNTLVDFGSRTENLLMTHPGKR